MEMSEKGGRRKEGGGLRKQKQNVKLQGDTWKQLILQMLTTQVAAGMGGEGGILAERLETHFC